jgi:hypothetical protein
VAVNRPCSTTPARSQPAISSLAGKPPSCSSRCSFVIDTVECRCQVGVEDPAAVGVTTRYRREDRLDRVVTATAGTEAVGLRLRLPCPDSYRQWRSLGSANYAVHHRGDPGALARHRRPQCRLFSLDRPIRGHVAGRDGNSVADMGSGEKHTRSGTTRDRGGKYA